MVQANAIISKIENWISLVILAWSLSTGNVGIASQLTYVGKAAAKRFIFHNLGNKSTHPGDSHWVHFQGNPIIGGHNVYAPSAVQNGSLWHVYTGGWRDIGQLNDRIYLNILNNELTCVVGVNNIQLIDNGIYLHACDPSVVKKKKGEWVMAMTVCDSGNKDWIAITTSNDGINWSPSKLQDRYQEVHFANSNDVKNCARPSLNWNVEKGRWEMYFDATINNISGQYLAISTDLASKNFSIVGYIGDMFDAEIKKIGKFWIAAYRHQNEQFPWRIWWAESEDGIAFIERGLLVEPDPLNDYDKYSVDNPGFAVDADGRLCAVLFGGSSINLTRHKVGIVFPQCASHLFTGAIHHIHRQAIDKNNQSIETHQYNSIDRILIEDRPNTVVVDIEIGSSLGDSWYLDRSLKFPINMVQ